MTSEQTIRFGRYRQAIDGNIELNDDECVDYMRLLAKVKSDLPHGPTQIMKDLVASSQFQECVRLALVQAQKALIASLPSLLAALLKR